MDAGPVLRSLAREMRQELTGRILPYWADAPVDREGSGFHGYIGPDGVPRAGAERGAILNSRILWTFSAAARRLGRGDLLPLADRAADEVLERFTDPVHGGVYWMIDPSGRPTDDRKHIYAQAFALYGLAEHYRATGREASLRGALELFHRIEAHARDPEHGGYLEAFDRDWGVRTDDRLSEVDLRAAKSQNTHLHLLEAYTALVQVWPDPVPRDRLGALVRLFIERIVDAATGHTRPFFDRDWTVRSTVVSFGHDIETAWLLGDAATPLDDPELTAAVAKTRLLLADTVLREGIDPGGGVYYAVDEDGVVDREKEWWTQAEAIVGFLHAHRLAQCPGFLAGARDTWRFVRTHMRDLHGGEWHRRVDQDGTIQPGHEKVGPWKGPYHGARACLEVMTLADEEDAGP